MAADGEAEAEFVFFDRVGRELLGLPLLSLLRHGHPPGIELARVLETARVDDSIPKELSAVISRKFRFVVSISNKIYQNEGTGNLSFQVHRIDPVAGRQAKPSVCYRASSSGSGSGSGGVPAATITDPVSSPDLLAYETLSPEVCQFYLLIHGVVLSLMYQTVLVI